MNNNELFLYAKLICLLVKPMDRKIAISIECWLIKIVDEEISEKIVIQFARIVIAKKVYRSNFVVHCKV